MMGVEVPENDHFKNGHRIQKIITDHLQDIAPLKTLAHLQEKIGEPFDIYEQDVKYGDPRCKLQAVFEIEGEQVKVTGFFDMKNTKLTRFGEVKAYGVMWSVGKFATSYQRKLYGLLDPKATESVLITALPDEKQWEIMPPKVYVLPYTQKDRKEALAWVTRAVKTIREGKFDGGLVDGKCIDAWCLYGENCQFK